MTGAFANLFTVDLTEDLQTGSGKIPKGSTIIVYPVTDSRAVRHGSETLAAFIDALASGYIVERDTLIKVMDRLTVTELALQELTTWAKANGYGG